MLRQTVPWLKEVRTAWLRLQKLQQLNLLEATHTPKPEQLRQQILGELNPSATPPPSPFAQLTAYATAQAASR